MKIKLRNKLLALVGLYTFATLALAQEGGGLDEFVQLGEGVEATFDQTKLSIWLVAAGITAVLVILRFLPIGAALGVLIVGGWLLGHVDDFGGWLGIA